MRVKRKMLSVLLLAILLLAAAALGVYHAESKGVNLSDEQVKTVVISSEKDITEMGGSFYNNILQLSQDITVTESCFLASKDHPFTGVFDGNGHTINVYGADIQKSFFGYIGEGGVVKNLHINVLTKNTKFDSKTGAVFALENSGTIMDCKVTVRADVSISGKHSAVVAYNKGLIKNVCVDATFRNTCKDNTARRSNIGFVASYNYGKIESCAVYAAYEDFPEAIKENVFSGYVNVSLGVLYSANNGGIITDSIAIVPDSMYACDKDEADLTFVDDSNRSRIFSAEYLENTLGFDLERWTLIKGELELIPQGEDE